MHTTLFIYELRSVIFFATENRDDSGTAPKTGMPASAPKNLDPRQWTNTKFRRRGVDRHRVDIEYRPVAELDVKKCGEDVAEWCRRDAMKTVEYDYCRQFVVNVVASDTSVSDRGQILAQFSSGLAVNVEHSYRALVDNFS